MSGDNPSLMVDYLERQNERPYGKMRLKSVALDLRQIG